MYILKKIFVSYSSKDKNFVNKIIEKLPRDSFWVDYFDLDFGDNILDKIESGIIKCSEFLLILSKNSLESKWVKQEADMAVIRSLKDGFMKIRVVQLDDCIIPLRFQPLKYLSIKEEITEDRLVEKILKYLMKKGEDEKKDFEFRRFVNRNRETDLIQGYILDNDTKIINLTGLYGIGKTTLLNESISRILKNPDIIKVTFTRSFFGSRLCKELCALAKIDLPNEKDSEEEINKKNIQAIEELISQNKIIIFDDFQNVIDENNIPIKDVGSLIEHCSKIDVLKKCPLFIISTRKFKLNLENIESIKSIRLRGLEDKFIEMIVKMELRDVSNYSKIDNELKERFIKSLCTYPLAAKFAAPLLEDYSVEFVLENIQYIQKLRIDLARVLLSKIEISTSQEEILELLGFSEDALSISEIQEILGINKDILLNDVDYLVQHNFIEFEKDKIGLHPILIDIFSSKAITAGIIKKEGDKITSAFKIIFQKTKTGELEYVHWLSKLQRIYIITGKFDEAQKIWYNCKGELKSTIMDLYTRSRNYDLALKYCNKYLEDEPDDFSVKMFKIKSLIRLSKHDIALELVNELLDKQPKNPILLHQKARVYLRNTRIPDNYKISKELLLKALSYRKDYFPVIRDLAETLLYLGDLDESERYLNDALNKAPLDQYILTLYGKVLGELGKGDEAIARLKIALGNIPDAAPFFHRLGWLYQKKGDFQEAYKYYKKACDLDNHYFEARFGLIYCCIQLEGKLHEAKSHIEELEKVVFGRSKDILACLKAEYSLKEGDIEGAYKIIQRILFNNQSDIIILGSAIKITIAMSKKWFKDGLKTKAEELANEVERYIEQIETLSPLDPYIQTYKRWLKDLLNGFK